MICNDNIFFTVMHKIDREGRKTDLSEISNEDVIQYISDLMTDIMNNVNYKHYKIKRSTSEIVKLTQEAMNVKSLSDEEKESIAKKYLEAEIKGHNQARRMKKNVKKGFLVQALLHIEDKLYYFISKVEINDYLDSAEMHKRNGLPYEDKSLKTCIFVYNLENQLEDILITDKQNAAYWHSEFLELEECSNNEKCTLDVFTMLERKIKLGTKKTSADYYSLRNSLVAYFQTPKTFQYDEMVKAVFKGYEAKNPEELDIDKIQKSIVEEIQKKKLDTEFSIVPSAVKTKFKKSIRINSFINLQLEGADTNYDTMIFAIEEDNKKYLKIETEDEAYNAFKNNYK